MRRRSVFWGVACAIAFLVPHAGARPATAIGEGYQVATVVSVKQPASASNYAGDNPSDAPLQGRDYSYDIGIRLNCNLYVGRYESATKYLPSVFAPDHPVEVRLHKHILYVSLPYSDEEVMMGIVRHQRVKDEACLDAGPNGATAQRSNHQLMQNKFKGGLV